MDQMHPEDWKKNYWLYWLSVDQRVQQSLNVTTFNYVNNVCPYYVKVVFDYALQSRITSTNYARLKVPFRKTNMGRKVYHILAPRFGTNSQVYWKETV